MFLFCCLEVAEREQELNKVKLTQGERKRERAKKKRDQRIDRCELACIIKNMHLSYVSTKVQAGNKCHTKRVTIKNLMKVLFPKGVGRVRKVIRDA